MNTDQGPRASGSLNCVGSSNSSRPSGATNIGKVLSVKLTRRAPDAGELEG